MVSSGFWHTQLSFCVFLYLIIWQFSKIAFFKKKAKNDDLDFWIWVSFVQKWPFRIFADPKFFCRKQAFSGFGGATHLPPTARFLQKRSSIFITGVLACDDFVSLARCRHCILDQPGNPSHDLFCLLYCHHLSPGNPSHEFFLFLSSSLSFTLCSIVMISLILCLFFCYSLSYLLSLVSSLSLSIIYNRFYSPYLSHYLSLMLSVSPSFSVYYPVVDSRSLSFLSLAGWSSHNVASFLFIFACLPVSSNCFFLSFLFLSSPFFVFVVLFSFIRLSFLLFSFFSLPFISFPFIFSQVFFSLLAPQNQLKPL